MRRLTGMCETYHLFSYWWSLDARILNGFLIVFVFKGIKYLPSHNKTTWKQLLHIILYIIYLYIPTYSYPSKSLHQQRWYNASIEGTSKPTPVHRQSRIVEHPSFPKPSNGFMDFIWKCGEYYRPVMISSYQYRSYHDPWKGKGFTTLKQKCQVCYVMIKI